MRIFTTGGTIDKVYIPTSGRLMFDRSHVADILTKGRFPVTDLVIEPLMLVDSVDMTDQQRGVVVSSVLAATEPAIVITHGTDSIVQTAQAIETTLGETNQTKTVILTGAMIPFSLRDSDASFNLGTALAGALSLSPGVYVAMNGRYFPASGVVKDRVRGVFVGR